MDTPRKIGTSIVMIIPTFVGAGALWDIWSSWVPVILWTGAMAVLAGSLISGRLSFSRDS